METAGYRGTSRRQKKREPGGKERKAAHFRTVHFGGYEETQMICYLWELVKSMEAVEAGMETLPDLAKQTRGRIRVEMRRYFARQKRRLMILVWSGVLAAACGVGLFGFLLGIDRVSGDSMYPYLNNGDWILYSRLEKEFQMDEVIVFERDGENYVKRIAGLPGDTVEISASGSRVVVNGVQMRESYVTLTSPAGNRTSQEESMENEESTGGNDPMGDLLTILGGQYLVLGDNRKVSIDSRNRNMGTVPEEDILGRVILVARMKW